MSQLGINKHNSYSCLLYQHPSNSLKILMQQKHFQIFT